MDLNRDIREKKEGARHLGNNIHDKFDPSGNVQWGDSIN